MILSFNDFIDKYNLTNKTTSNTKIYQVLCFIGLNNVGINLRDGLFKSDIGYVNLHSSKESHWDVYNNEDILIVMVVHLFKKLSNFNIKRNGHCLYSEYKIQGLTSKKYSFCANYCFYRIYLGRKS